nr:protein RTF1 homolog [Tanacetum cinerariifolium]
MPPTSLLPPLMVCGIGGWLVTVVTSAFNAPDFPNFFQRGCLVVTVVHVKVMCDDFVFQWVWFLNNMITYDDFVVGVKVARILVWQHHEHGVCSDGGSDTLLFVSILANLSHYALRPVSFVSQVFNSYDLILFISSYAFFDAVNLFVAVVDGLWHWWLVKVARILVWQHHEHGVCSDGGSDTLLFVSILANLSHYALRKRKSPDIYATRDIQGTRITSSLSIYANGVDVAHNEDGVQGVLQSRNVKRRVTTDQASTSLISSLCMLCRCDTSINNGSVANASSLGRHTLESVVAAATSVDDVIIHIVSSSDGCTTRIGVQVDIEDDSLASDLGTCSTSSARRSRFMGGYQYAIYEWREKRNTSGEGDNNWRSKKQKEKSNQSRKDTSPPHTSNWTMRSSARTTDRAKAKDE